MSTYTPITSVTLASAQSSVTFSSIPQTYTDLVVVLSVKGTAAGNDIDVIGQFNFDANSNYSWTRIYGDGTSAGSLRLTSQTVLRLGNMAGSGFSFSPMVLNVQNYSNTTTFKTMLGRPNNPHRIIDGYVNLWRSISAITDFTILASTGNFDTGSTFALYGISASDGITPKATGGNQVYSDGTYWYHAFTSSGVFTPLQSLTADYLVIAGGGSGGAAGGGAGGLRCTVGATGGGGSLESAASLVAQNYVITIGAGGAGSVYSAAGNSGSNSSISGTGFTTITSIGGGRGGGYGTGENGVTGGSGGGGGGAGGATPTTGGAGTANQGYAGGNGALFDSSGGGGGAGAVGSAASTANPGAGGNGVTTSISGTSTTYAGGGGGAKYNGSGAAGGSGGGGAGAASTYVSATSGTANTGSGGGGYQNASSGSGGSGLVIVRYAV